MQVSVGGGQYPLCRAQIPNPQGCSSSLFFYSKSCTHCYLLPSLVSKNIPIGKLQYCSGYETGPRNQRNVGAIYASEAGAETSTTAAETDDAERWVLEPVGKFFPLNLYNWQKKTIHRTLYFRYSFQDKCVSKSY